MEALGYLVGQQVGGVQQHFGAEHDGTVYPVHGAVSAGAADDCRKVVGSNVELVGIVGDVAFLLAVAAHECLELLKQFLMAGTGCVVHSAVGGLLDVLHVCHHSPDYMQHGIATVGRQRGNVPKQIHGAQQQLEIPG